MATNTLNLPTEETLQSIATTLSNMQGNVQGVKGNEEAVYRTGQVNLTAANIGALPANTTYVSSVNGGSGAVTGIATQQELNEVRSIAEGAGAAMSFTNYASLISDFNSAADDDYKLGQSIYINTLNVPDLWIYEVSDVSILYYYTTDEAFTDLLKQQGYVQIGYYKVAALETQKVDLSNYVSLDGAQTITGVKSFTDFSLINDYTNGKTLTSYLSGKVDTNADSIFNVINATDIAVSNILTQAQIDVITNGKPTIIKGTFLDYDNPILCSVRTANNYGNRSYVGAWLGSKQAGLATYAVFTIMNTGQIKIEKALIYYNLQASNEMMAYFGDVTASRNLYFNKGYSTGSTLQLGWSNGNIAVEATSSTFKVACNNFISRNGTNLSDIGSSTVKWKDLYFAGDINPNSSGYGLTLPDTTNFTADKEITTNDIISDAYDSTATYAIGDLVTYNNTLYKCTTAITTAEAWDSTHWTATTIADEIVTKNTAQTITGEKTFNNTISFIYDELNYPTYKYTITQNSLYNLDFLQYGTSVFTISTSGIYSGKSFIPKTHNSYSLGSSTQQWQNLYLVGDINPNSSGYGLIVPSTANYTADNTIATIESITGYPGYDSTSTYAVGDKVIYDGVGYRCKTAITTAEAFDSTKWEVIQLKNYVDIDTPQVIKGTKTVKSIQFVKDTSNPTSGSKLEIQNDNGYNSKIRFNGYGFMFTANAVQPEGNVNFGANSSPWKKIFVNTLHKSNNTYGAALPDMSAWTANKELATTDIIPTVSSSDKDKYLHTNSSTGALEWTSVSVPNVVQDLTSNTAGTLDATAWGNLKTTHSATISSPTMTGLDSAYEFVNIKLSIDSNNQFVKLSKNTTNKYSGLFFIEESSSLYEITVYYNGTNIILRCATVY